MFNITFVNPISHEIIQDIELRSFVSINLSYTVLSNLEKCCIIYYAVIKEVRKLVILNLFTNIRLHRLLKESSTGKECPKAIDWSELAKATDRTQQQLGEFKAFTLQLSLFILLLCDVGVGVFSFT